MNSGHSPKMFYFVYILYSHKDKKLYVGCTNSLEQRLKKHYNGHVIATKNRRPLELIYYEKFKNKADSFNRERFLKSLWGSREKKKIKENFLKNL